MLGSAKTAVQQVASGKGYQELVTGLIVQGVSTLKATEVTVIGREKDRALIVKAAQEAMGRMDGVQLRVSDADVLPASSCVIGSGWGRTERGGGGGLAYCFVVVTSLRSVGFAGRVV